MNRISCRCIALAASLSAAVLFAASPACGAPDTAGEQVTATKSAPFGTPRIDGESARRPSPPARGAGRGRARPKAAPSRPARPAPRKTPPPRTRPPVKRTPPPRRITPPPRRINPPPRGATPRQATPPTRGTPRPRSTTPPRRAPGPEVTPPTRRLPRDTEGRNGNDFNAGRDYFRKLWQRRLERDRDEGPAPRRRGPDVTVTPRTSDAPDGVIERPGRPGGDDHPDAGEDDHGSQGGGTHGHWGKHDGKPGYGKYGRKHGHRHHASCGCYLQDWWRLLCGFGSFAWRVCDPYDYRYLAGPTYITYAGAAYPLEPFGALPCAATGPEAWVLLADGHTAAAYEIFECLSQSIPDDGYLLVGLAIAATSVGEHDVAVTALRTAMRTDPVSLLDVPAGDSIDALLTVAADHYDARARSGYGDVDALFMVGAMRYLLGQDHAAQYAVEVAVTLGDDDASTRNLKGLIEATPPELRRPE